jgi:hypothetical protein
MLKEEQLVTVHDNCNRTVECTLTLRLVASHVAARRCTLLRVAALRVAIQKVATSSTIAATQCAASCNAVIQSTIRVKREERERDMLTQEQLVTVHDKRSLANRTVECTLTLGLAT